MIYAPVKTAYPESKDLGRFHRPGALLNVQSDFSNSRHASKAYASLSTLVDIRSEESPRRQNSMSIRERKSKFTMKVGEHLGVSWFTSHEIKQRHDAVWQRASVMVEEDHELAVVSGVTRSARTLDAEEGTRERTRE